MNEGYQYGKVGYPMDAIKSSFFQLLHKNQQNTAYTMGVIFGDNQAQAQQEAINKKVDSGKKKGIKRKGKVVFEGSAKGAKLSDIQRKSISAIGWIVSRTTHNTVHFYRSELNSEGKRVFADNIGKYKKGEDVAPNGFFDTQTGDVWIDLNAGDNGEGVILWTAAHEFTHLIKQNSPVMFKRLSDFLMQEYGAKGVDINELINDKLKTVEKSHPELSDIEQRELAHEEVVADSLQRMFTDTDVLSKIEKLKAQDHKLWQRLKDFLTNLQAKIKELYNEFDSQSQEAALVKQMGDAVDTLADMFAEALVDAGNVQESTETKQAENNAIKHSDRYGIDNYSEKEYNDFGWATYNKIWTANERNTMFSRFADYKHNKNKYPTTKYGEAVIFSFDHPNIIAYIKGGISSPEVTKIVRINSTDDLDISLIRERIIENEFKQSAFPFTVVEKYYGEEYIDIHRKRDYVPFREYDRRRKGENSKGFDTKGRELQNRREDTGSGENRNTESKGLKISEKNGHKYSFGGRNSKTANTSLLASAHQMENEGKDSEDIRQETGWFRGYDGGWRYEINDFESSLIENPKLKIYNDKNGITFYGKISDVLNHKDLFKAYPKLKNVNFVINTLDSGVDGAYLTDSNYICLNLELFKRNTKEYQDYYDKHLKAEVEKIESTPEYKEYSAIVEDTGNYFANYKEWRKLTDAAIKKFFSSELGKRYYELKWGDNGFKGEKTEFGWDKGAKSVLMHELQHAIQLIEGFEDGTYGDDENYYNNAGEREARDVQTRLDYTAEQRKSIRPNVDRTDVTFRKSVLSHPPDNQSENIDNLNSVKDRDIRYSDRKKYWRTGMSSVEISNILRVAKRQMNNGNNYIDDATKWLYTIYSGKEYFALYSTADAGTEPTILYASKGNKAAKENEWINNVLQESGDENNDIVRSRESVSAILRVHRNEQDNDFVDNRKSADRQRSNKNTGIYRKNANYRPDSALLTCLENIEGGRRERNKYRGIDIFELDNTKFSERGSQYAKELEEVNKQITKENEKLKEDVSDLKELLKLQTQETHGKMMKKSSIDAVAKKIMRESNADGDVSEFASLIKDVYSYIINGEDVNYETIKEKAKPAVQWLENNQKITKGALSSEAQEIFNHLKGARIYISPEIRSEIEYANGKGGYNKLKQNLTGWVVLTSNPADISLDSMWGELAEEFSGYFKSDIHELEQLSELSSVVSRLRDTRYSSGYDADFYSAYEAEIKQNLFEKIYDGFWDVSTLHTVADKYAKQINLLKAKHKASMDKIRESREEAISSIREKYRESTQNARERRNQTLYRTKIKGLHSKMDRMLRNPTDNSYVPKEFFSLILDTLSTVDIRTGNTNKTQEAISAVYDEYQKIKDNPDTEYSAVYDADLADEIFALKEHLKSGNIYSKDLTSTELQAIYETLQSIYGTVLDAKKLIGENGKMAIRESGNKIIDEQEEISERYKDSNKFKSLIKTLDDKSSLFYLNSIRAILKMSNFNENAELVRLTKALNEGVKKQYDFKMMVNKKLDALVKTKEGQKAFDSAVRDMIDFGWAKMTKMQAAQLMLTIERESKIGTKHIATGGATITDSKYRDNVEKRRDNAKLIKYDTLQMMSDVREKLSGDEWMQKYIEVAKEIMRVDSKRALNETSQMIKHRDIAPDRYYIPFVTDNSFTVREIEGLVRDATIEGRGAFKSTTKGAGNALYIEGLDIVLDRCINTAADYCGLAVPIRNINRALNVKNDESGRSVKDSIKKNWKSDGLKLIEQTIFDLQTGRKNDSIAILDTIKSAFITSTLNGNISVAIKQAASLDTAFAVLNYRPSAVAWAEFIKTVKNYNSIIDEIDEHTSEHCRRRIGLTTDEIAVMKQNSGFFGKVNRKLPAAINGNKWIQMIDCWTTATFWKMAKQDIEKAVKNGKYQFEIGSDEYWKAVTDLYEETVETTQPMYDPLHRSEMQKNAVSNKIFMFKTQPLQNAGMLYEAVHGLAAAKISGNTELAKERAKKLSKVIYSQTRSAVTFALMTMIAAAIKGKMKRYKDDDDELTFASMAKRIAQDMGGIGTGLVLPIGGSEIYNYLESVISGNGYVKALLSYPTIDWINDYASALTNVFKYPSVQNITKLLIKFGDITGQPATNYYNIIHGIGYNITDIVNGDFGEFEASEENSTSHLIKRAHSAYEKGNNAEAKQYIQEIIDSKVAKGNTEKEAKSAIRSSLTSKYKPLFLEAYKNKDDKTMAEIRKFLNSTGIYGTASQVVLATQDWIKKSKE